MSTTQKSARLRKLLVLALMAAIAYVVMLVGRIPVVMFLKYDPKDVVITIAGFIYGPMASFAISAVVSLIEMFTVSDTGPIGLVMNVLATCSFACTAAFIYKKKQGIAGAVLGLLAGVALMTGMMLLWNYFITPIYLGWPREEVAALLVPAFLPFNLLKGGLNAAITLLLYKPLVNALRRAKVIPERDALPAPAEKNRLHKGVYLVALVVLATCVLLVLVLQGVI